jgi:hypothetical protein
MVDQVKPRRSLDDHQAASDVGIANEIDEGRVGQPKAVAAEDYQHVQVARMHQVREVGLHSWSAFSVTR